MKKVSMLILLLILVVWVVPVSAITWGQPDSDHDNVGAVMVQDNYGWRPICSGTLIHEEVVLTAGHCTASIKSFLDAGLITDVGVTFEQDLSSVTTPLEVLDIITHPDYKKSKSNPYDVGVLILDSPSSITPAALPDENLLDQLTLRQGKEGMNFTVVGYGGTLSWPPPEITYEDERQYAESEYLKLLKSWLLLSQNKAKDNGGTCYGDSGGPAFLELSGIEYLVGVTSWGDTPCVAIGFCYRTDILETISFIENDVLGPIPYSGSYALWGGRGDLLFNTATMASPITLPAGNPTLSFWTWYDIEDSWDFGYVQISTDGGFTWTSLANSNTTSSHDPDAHPDVVANLPGFTDSNSGWVQETFNLTAYAETEILIRFLYITDWTVSFPGFYIDDIEITGAPIDDLESGGGNWILDGWVLTSGGVVN